MGSGAWSAESYFTKARARRKAGVDDFAYSARAQQSGQLRVHQTLDPQGLGLRESRDSDDHPESNSIIICLDVTGSMGRVVRGIHRDLPRLHELLLGHDYLPHPQILFAAVGDATCDRVPLQVGQFESDNRMDQNLEDMILEGGGGGQMTESYELAFYVAARHTAIDCFDKRGRKGYLFLIGDELAYPQVDESAVRQLIGSGPQRDVPLAQIVAEAREKYHVYFIIPAGGSYGRDPKVLNFWQSLLGERSVIVLGDPNDTAECIAMTIGINEGAVSGPEQAHQQLDARAKPGVVGRIIEAIGGVFGGEGNRPPPSVTRGTRRL